MCAAAAVTDQGDRFLARGVISQLDMTTRYICIHRENVFDGSERLKPRWAEQVAKQGMIWTKEQMGIIIGSLNVLVVWYKAKCVSSFI